jgi:signal transduction histidine kinase
VTLCDLRNDGFLDEPTISRSRRSRCLALNSGVASLLTPVSTTHAATAYVCCFEHYLAPALLRFCRSWRAMLFEFIVLNRTEIIKRCRAKVIARSVPPPTPAEIDHGVPLFLEQLVDALRDGLPGNAAITKTAMQHGHELRAQGFTVSQVVHDYGDICQAVTELAVETNAPLSAADFRVLNRCLDDAIASAVTEFGREQSQDALARESKRAGVFAHELRNLLNTAIVAFDVLKSGNVGIAGSTGAVLNRSLLGLRNLIGQSLDDVRRTNGVQHHERVFVSGFIEEVAAGARLEADAQDVRFVTLPVTSDIAVDADREVLAAVVKNLLQNAFKFTQPRTSVTLRVRASSARVLIEVEDECGGLPSGDLFRHSSSAAPIEAA